jgi:hypothetical protein
MLSVDQLCLDMFSVCSKCYPSYCVILGMAWVRLCCRSLGMMNKCSRIKHSSNLKHGIRPWSSRSRNCSEARYSALTAQSGDCIVRCTPDRRITFANDTFCNYFQRSADTIVGTVITDCLVQDGSLFVTRFEQSLERLNQTIERQGTKQDQSVAAAAVEHRCTLLLASRSKPGSPPKSPSGPAIRPPMSPDSKTPSTNSKPSY